MADPASSNSKVAKKGGFCIRCGRRTHSISVLPLPLTNEAVFNGTCILCNPTHRVPKKAKQVANLFVVLEDWAATEDSSEGRGFAGVMQQELLECQSKKWTSFSFNRRAGYAPLKTPPDCFKHLPNITQVLKCCFQEIEELPESVGRLVELTELHCQSNRIHVLPASILGNLSNLTILNMADNQIMVLPDSIFGKLEQLQRLNLQCNMLKKLPDSIFKLEGLTELSLGGNQITELPKAVGYLTNLETLDLQANRLQELPDTIGCLVKLEKLELQSNMIKELPYAVGRLKSLVEIDATSNFLDNLPPTIFMLPKLKLLRCPDNPIQSLLPKDDEDIENLKTSALVELDLEGCDLLETLPESIGKLQL